MKMFSLLGYCCEGGEMILVYEFASRGSLDSCLKSPHLTWRQRIKICLDAAKGLSYLHDPRETHRRLIHCDIKSGNILLDEQWNAKISELGLSIMGSANEQHSVIVTLAAGTEGYIDPLYWMTHTLTKESDVHSFGVVLFEVLCGTFCCTYNNGCVEHNLVPTWIKSYKDKNLNDIIFKNPNIQAMDQRALEIFSDIAYRCLKESREDRPNMTEVVTELETALDNQEFSEGKLLFDYEEMTKGAEPPLNYKSKDELMTLLAKGVLLNGGKRWFSLNKNGEHCEMISFAECLDSRTESKLSSKYKSRFPVGPYDYNRESLKIKIRVRTRFLSPGITYMVNFVFKFYASTKENLPAYIALKYKLQGETKSSTSYLADEREDGWWMCELCQFTSDHRVVELEILFGGYFLVGSLAVEGIEFRPLEKVEHKDEKQHILNSDSYSDSNANWEEKMPTDYEDIMRRSKKRLEWTTKKEAYSLIFKGFLINDKQGSIWFSLDKNGKKCHMLSLKMVLGSSSAGKMLSLPESSDYEYSALDVHPTPKFGEAFQCDCRTLYIDIEIQPQLVSSQTTYATYLVYKLPENQSIFEDPLEVRKESPYGGRFIYLVSPQTPVIRSKADQKTHNAVHRPEIKGLPQQRHDGWMEVQFWEFQTAATTNMFPKLYLGNYNNDILAGLIIEGVEFRPV